MAKITLPNGTQIEADEAMLARLLNGTENGVFYNSSTHGLIAIEEMATPHLVNAIAKSLRASIDANRHGTVEDFLAYLKRGIGTDSLTIVAMVEELATRQD